MTKENEITIYGFDRDKIDLIRRTIAKGATDDELKLFLYQCQRTGLDPFSRQIVFLKYKTREGDRMSIITSIDGYRLIADRTGKYAGSDDYRFDEGLTEFEHIQSGRGNPTTATCTVYKLVKNMRVPFTATVRWDEYYPGDGKGFMWNKMPYLMLGKCAEALALRKAFPVELSGIYTREEMEQAGVGDDEIIEVRAETEPIQTQPEHPSQEQNKVRSWRPEQIRALMEQYPQIKHPKHAVGVLNLSSRLTPETPVDITLAWVKLYRDARDNGKMEKREAASVADAEIFGN